MNKTRIQAGSLVCALALSSSWASCAAQGGSETGNPIAAFTNPGCDASLDQQKANPTAARRPSDPPDDLGLYCIAWEVDPSGVLLLEVRNLQGACVADWQADGELNEGELQLRLEKGGPCGEGAACLGCSYDLGFELTGLDSTAPLPLSLWKREDCDPAKLYTQVTLPLDSEPRGILCRAMENAPGIQHLSCEGGRYAACGDGDPVLVSCGDAQTCDSGLTCGALATGLTQRCLPSCADDADCAGDADFLVCDQGLCRLDPARSF